MMSTHFAQDRKKSRSKVLVFGEKTVVCQIARELAEEGFEPILLSQLTSKTLPPIADPNSLEEIREILSEFVRLAGPRAMVHPGTTFWAERPELPIIAEELGLTVIGPPVRAVSLFNDRLN